MAFEQSSDPHHEEVTRLIQEGRQPEDLKGRAQLMVDKFRGDVPLGVDAPNKTTRKIIGGGGSLLVVLKNGFFGFFAVVLGALFVWAGSSGHFDLRTFAIGIGGLILGAFGLARAWRAWGVLKAISKA